MNDKRVSSLLLLATLVTVFILVGVHFIPNKTLTVVPSPSTTVYLLSDTMPDGQASARWTKTDNSQWQCHYPENFSGSYFPCAYAIDLSTSASTGMDLTSYTHLNLQLTYVGSANKIRIAIRNYNALYSNPDDTNSGKFNNLQIDTQKIKPDSITKIALSAFTVADWWLAQYQIPMDQSLPEFNNTKTIIIDFGEPLKPGIHTLTLTKVELEGVWISTEHAYLIILCIWISGIFIYAAISLIQLNAQLKHDTNVINELSSTNEQLQEQTDRFRKLSTVDPLTQIYNRFGIDQVVASIVKNDQGVYGLMVIDIDHFKRVNDQRGHDVGDQVLQHITAIIQQHLRAGDFIGRWGGEEFIVLMPNTNKDIALALAEVIRTAIFETPFPTQKPLSLSASFGVGLQLIDEDFSSCFKRVDNALYAAKHQGRNCCIYAKEDI